MSRLNQPSSMISRPLFPLVLVLLVAPLLALPCTALEGSYLSPATQSEQDLEQIGAIPYEHVQGGLPLTVMDCSNSSHPLSFYSYHDVTITHEAEGWSVIPEWPECPADPMTVWQEVGSGALLRRCGDVWMTVSAREAEKSSTDEHGHGHGDAGDDDGTVSGISITMLRSDGAFCSAFLTVAPEPAAAAVKAWETWAYSMIGVGVSCLVSLVGVSLLVCNQATVQRHLPELMALSCGTFIGSVCFSLLPETAEELGMSVQVTSVMLVGVIFGMLSETVVHGMAGWCSRRKEKREDEAEGRPKPGPGVEMATIPLRPNSQRNGSNSKSASAKQADGHDHAVSADNDTDKNMGMDPSSVVFHLHSPAETDNTTHAVAVTVPCTDENCPEQGLPCTEENCAVQPCTTETCPVAKACPECNDHDRDSRSPSLSKTATATIDTTDRAAYTLSAVEAVRCQKGMQSSSKQRSDSDLRGKDVDEVDADAHAHKHEDELEHEHGHDHMHSHGHGHGGHSHSHGASSLSHAERLAEYRHFAIVDCVADAIHNFIDGALIGATFLADTRVGWTTVVAIALHELPQELGDFAVLIRAGLSVKQALLLNLAVSTTAILGAICAILLGERFARRVTDVLPFAAGLFMYLALTCLMPDMMHSQGKGWRQQLRIWTAFAIGVGLIAVLLAVPWHH